MCISLTCAQLGPERNLIFNLTYEKAGLAGMCETP